MSGSRPMWRLNDDAPTSVPAMPEKRLQSAVLTEAIASYGSDNSHLAAEAERWIMADARDGHPFSFVEICDSLGLNASAVRASLRHRRGGLGVAFSGLRRDFCAICMELRHGCAAGPRRCCLRRIRGRLGQPQGELFGVAR